MNKLHIPPLDEQAAKAALEHQKILAKPPLALGKLEPVAIRIAAMTGNPAPRLKDKAIVLFAADHHIADHGLSLTSTDVTYIQTRNFLQGGGTINAFTRNAGARLSVVDVGVNYDFGDLPGLVKRKVMHGANDFSREPAMTREQALECLQVGIDMAREEKNKGLDIVAAGEMGIGNTTPSSAIVAVLTGTPVETVTGRGSGVRGEVIRKKIKLIEQGIALNKPDPSDAIDVLAKVGGPEIGAMAGLMLGAASLRVPIVIDGFIAGAPRPSPRAFARKRRNTSSAPTTLRNLGISSLWTTSASPCTWTWASAWGKARGRPCSFPCWTPPRAYFLK